jgi:hypothetical protein
MTSNSPPHYSRFDQANIALLVIAIVGLVIVGSLFTVVHGSVGEQGPRGPRGAQGTPAPAITAAVTPDATVCKLQSSSIVQYSSIVTLSLSSMATQNLTGGQTIYLGSIPQTISLPPSSVSGTLYQVNTSLSAPVLVDSNTGVINAGPMPTTWNSGAIVQLSIVYGV